MVFLAHVILFFPRLLWIFSYYFTLQIIPFLFFLPLLSSLFHSYFFVHLGFFFFAWRFATLALIPHAISLYHTGPLHPDSTYISPAAAYIR